jgi:hypothetical protein
MVSNEVIAILLSGISISASIIYYSIVLRNQNQSRQTATVIQLHRHKSSPEENTRFWKLMALTWEDHDDYQRRYGPLGNPEQVQTRALLSAEWGFYDGLGLMLKKGLVDLDTVYSLFGLRMTLIWYKFETLLDGIRSTTSMGGGPRIYENMEYLAEEILKLNNKFDASIPVDFIHPTTTRYKEIIQ